MMRKIIEYKMICRRNYGCLSPDSFDDEINDALKAGYELFGNHCSMFSKDDGVILHTQAMVKYAEEKKDGIKWNKIELNEKGEIISVFPKDHNEAWIAIDRNDIKKVCLAYYFHQLNKFYWRPYSCEIDNKILVAWALQYVSCPDFPEHLLKEKEVSVESGSEEDEG